MAFSTLPMPAAHHSQAHVTRPHTFLGRMPGSLRLLIVLLFNHLASGGWGREGFWDRVTSGGGGGGQIFHGGWDWQQLADLSLHPGERPSEYLFILPYNLSSGKGNIVLLVNSTSWIYEPVDSIEPHRIIPDRTTD